MVERLRTGDCGLEPDSVEGGEDDRGCGSSGCEELCNVDHGDDVAWGG